MCTAQSSLHLGVRLIAINGHGQKGLIESGLDGLLRNAVLAQGAARASSGPAELNEYLLPLGGLDHEYRRERDAA